MNITWFILFILGMVYLCGVNSAVYMEKMTYDTNSVGYCQSRDEQVGRIKLGESKDLKTQCGQATCTGEYIQYFTCGVVAAAPPCVVLDEDLSKPYPKCCKTVFCKEEKTNQI